MTSVFLLWIAFCGFAGLAITVPTPSPVTSGGAVATANRDPASPADGPIASPEPGWPQWRGPKRDGISDEKGLQRTWPSGGPKLLWKVDNLGQGWSSPIITGDRIYITGDVGGDLVIFAFNREGKPVWQARNGKAWKGSYPGARASCVYSEGRLYHMNAHGRVACLSAATGKELWAVDILERFQARNIVWAMSECLLVDGPRLIVTPGAGQALMAALDKKDGTVLWKTDPLEGDRASHCSPLLFRHGGRRLIASCAAKNGFGVDADTGKLLWTVPMQSPYGVNVATPVYGSGSIFYVTPYVYGACYRLNPGPDGPRPEKIWNTTLDTCTGALMLIGDLLYGSGYSKHKSWLCLDWASGAIRQDFREVTTSSAVYADGLMFCLTEDGEAALLSCAPGKLETAGRFRLVPEKTDDAWAHPVLLDGRLYLRYHDTLWCYGVRGGK